MKQVTKKCLTVLLSMCMVLTMCTTAFAAEENNASNSDRAVPFTDNEITPTDYSADDMIKSIKAIGFVDADGSKVQAIAVEYAEEILASSVKLDAFEIEDYDLLENSACELGENPGAATGIYVNSEAAISENDEKESGKYVIIEVNTDYQRASVPNYGPSMAIGVKQTGTIMTVENKSVGASNDWLRNYTVTQTESAGGNGIQAGTIVNSYTVEDGTYDITNISMYQLFTQEDGTAFHATNCWDEQEGEYVDVDLPYALYVPEDYNPNGKYALVLHVHDAGFMGTDPMITLTEAQGPANFASEEVQQIAKDNGLDGIIVVCPQIWTEIRCTRGGYTTSCGVPATWQLLDYLTEKYSIDMNRIYGTGQSMGGMQCMCMAAQRDNYFAGLWLFGCQWGSDYNKEVAADNYVHYASQDPTIWTTDSDGNNSDYGQNVYYLISDDNILSTNCQGDAYSSGVWKEMKTIYNELADTDFPYSSFNPLTETLDAQNEYVNELLAQENKTGIYWFGFSGGSHMLTWIYGHKLMAGYEWLLKQTAESEDERSKLTSLDAEWEEETDDTLVAASRTEDRYIGKDSNGTPVYFALAKEGSGTIGYNTTRYGKGGRTVLLPSGWTPEDAAAVTSEYGVYAGEAMDSTTSTTMSMFYVDGKLVEYRDKSYLDLTEGSLYKLSIQNEQVVYAVEQTMHYDNKVVANVKDDCFTNVMGEKVSSNYFGDEYVVVDATDGYEKAAIAVGDTVDTYFTSRGDGNTYGVYYMIIVSHSAIKVTTQAENEYAAVGEIATLSVEADSTVDSKLSYQWMYTIDGGETWKTCTSSASKKATFKFKMYKNFAGRQYRCVVTDASGEELVSETAALTIAY